MGFTPDNLIGWLIDLNNLDEIRLILEEYPFALWWYWLHLCLFVCREPDIPSWAPLLYQLQLLDIREKPDPLTLPIADRIRIGNQKRERGNFHFQREEFSMAARAYCMALDVLTTRSRGNPHQNVNLFMEKKKKKSICFSPPGVLYGSW